MEPATLAMAMGLSGSAVGTAATIGAALPSFSTLATLGSVIGTGLSTFGSIQQGQAANNSAKYNAQVQENNATIARQNADLAARKGAANAAIEQQKTRATVGAIKAEQAAKGIGVNTGSAVDVRSSAAELGELNAITIRSNAVRDAYGYQTQAANATSQADLDRTQGKNAVKASYIDAGSTFLGQTSTAARNGNYDAWTKSTALNN